MNDEKLTKDMLLSAYGAAKEVNRRIRNRVIGMREVQNSRKDVQLRGHDWLTTHMGNMVGNVEFVDDKHLEDMDGAIKGVGNVCYTYGDYYRNEYDEDVHHFPFECFEAETDEEAFDIYLAKCQERYRRDDEEERRRRKEETERHERLEYERLKKKFEGD